MGSVAIPLQRPNLGELLKLVGLPSKTAERAKAAEISDRANELVRTIVMVIDDLVSTSLDQRTADDFIKARAEIFPKYFAVMRALGDLAGVVLPKQAIIRLSAEWFSELESDFRELGPSAFGTDLSERGTFTIWTLRKIHDLAQEVEASAVPRHEASKKDGEMAIDFVNKVMWTRFHIDCLTKSMREKRPIYPDVVDQIRDGLRNAVDTYACIRRWVDLRSPQQDLDFGSIEWTNEDELLLTDSMQDLDRELA